MIGRGPPSVRAASRGPKSLSRGSSRASQNQENVKNRKEKIENLFIGGRLAQKLVTTNESLVSYFPAASTDIKNFIHELEDKEKQQLAPKPSRRYVSRIV